MKIILHKYKHDEQTKASKHIKKLENAFLNAQQNVYTTSCTYKNIHTIIPFQFINTCQQQDKTFILLPQKNTRLVSKFYKNAL
jgi:hypothetical protein